MANPFDVEKLAPEAYLNPDNFRTEFDGRRPDYAAEQEATGRKVATEWPTVSIGCNGCWGASGKEGATLTSYERIGYHAETGALLRGLLSGTAEIVVYRYPESGHNARTVIKPRGNDGCVPGA